MSWIDHIIVYLKQLIQSAITVQVRQKKIEDRMAQLETKLDKVDRDLESSTNKVENELVHLKEQIKDLHKDQRDCCQMHSKQLDQIVTLLESLIPPNPPPATKPAGFTASID